MATHGRQRPADALLALRIDALRLRAGLTITDLARKVGRQRAAVSHWISGRFEPPRQVIPELARVLGVSVERLMGAGLTPEQEEAERRYLSRIVRSGARLAELLDRFDDDELIALLEAHAPAPRENESAPPAAPAAEAAPRPIAPRRGPGRPRRAATPAHR